MTATRKQQQNNRRPQKNSRILSFNGQDRCLREWARITGIHPNTIHERLFRGWSVEKALAEPARKLSHAASI